MKYPNDRIGNRTDDLLARSAVPQPIAPPRTPSDLIVKEFLIFYLESLCLVLRTACIYVNSDVMYYLDELQSSKGQC
jgi:hypothetical protein